MEKWDTLPNYKLKKINLIPFIVYKSLQSDTKRAAPKDYYRTVHIDGTIKIVLLRFIDINNW